MNFKEKNNTQVRPFTAPANRKKILGKHVRFDKNVIHSLYSLNLCLLHAQHQQFNLDLDIEVETT